MKPAEKLARLHTLLERVQTRAQDRSAAPSPTPSPAAAISGFAPQPHLLEVETEGQYASVPPIIAGPSMLAEADLKRPAAHVPPTSPELSMLGEPVELEIDEEMKGLEADILVTEPEITERRPIPSLAQLGQTVELEAPLEAESLELAHPVPEIAPSEPMELEVSLPTSIPAGVYTPEAESAESTTETVRPEIPSAEALEVDERELLSSLEIVAEEPAAAAAEAEKATETRLKLVASASPEPLHLEPTPAPQPVALEIEPQRVGASVLADAEIAAFRGAATSFAPQSIGEALDATLGL